jgi:hypothetical protein
MLPKGSLTKDAPQNSRPDSLAPSCPTSRSELGFFTRMPADGRGVKENVSALESGEPGGFRIPLIPTDEHADSAEAGVEGSEAQVARREIVLLVVKRIVGDVHLAKDAEERAVGVEDSGRVVIDTGRATLKERGDNDGARFAGDLAETLGGRSRNRLGEIEIGRVFALTEIRRAKQLGETNDLGAFRRRLADALDGLAQVRFRLRLAAHLDEADSHFPSRDGYELSSIITTSLRAFIISKEPRTERVFERSKRKTQYEYNTHNRKEAT